jgi:hypothetical protein
MKHNINNIATVSSKKTTLATIKKFIKENSILARINSHFTDYTRIDIVRRSKAFINATFDMKKNKIINAEGFEIFELTSFTKNVYTKIYFYNQK